MSTHRVLVTGGAGFIGSHLTEALVESGHSVRVLDRLVAQVHGDGIPDHIRDDVEVVVGDVNDRALVDRVLDGVDVVFHEAAEVGVGQSMYEIRRYVEANDLGTATLLEAIVARRDSIRKLVVASSMSIYGEGAYTCAGCGVPAAHRSAERLEARHWEPECQNCGTQLEPALTSEAKRLEPSSVYAVTKQDQEQYCLIVGKAYSVPTVALRYFNVYGERQALSNPYTGACAIFASRLLNGEPPLIFEDGLQTRDFIHVSDIVRANLLALDTDAIDYRAVNIGTGRQTSILEVARVLARGLGLDIEPLVVSRFREGDIRHCVADITLARTRLGFEPAVELDAGLARLVEWAATHGADDRVLEATAELETRNLVK